MSRPQRCCWALTGGYCLQRVPPPVLGRNEDGRLIWVRAAFCVDHQLELRRRVDQAERLVRVVMAKQL